MENKMFVIGIALLHLRIYITDSNVKTIPRDHDSGSGAITVLLEWSGKLPVS